MYSHTPSLLGPLPLPPLPRRSVGVDVVTLGQYMRPTKKHMAVSEFVTPEAFKMYEDMAKVRCCGWFRGWGGAQGERLCG